MMVIDYTTAILIAKAIFIVAHVGLLASIAFAARRAWHRIRRQQAIERREQPRATMPGRRRTIGHREFWERIEVAR